MLTLGRLQVVAQLLSYPIGRLWALTMPQVKILGVPLNPGPFTVKEHVLITIMSNVSYQSAYAVRPSTMEATTSGHRLTYLSDRYHCCATRVLPANVQFWIPVDAGHVNSIGIFGMYALLYFY